MALALSIASVIVATELIGQYGNRAIHFQRKMDRLQAKISQMQARLASANHQVTEMRREAAYHDEFERILAASDSQLIRLEPHDRRADIGGALVISRRLSAGALEVVGLTAPGSDKHYAVWWLPRQGAPLPVAQLDPLDRITDGVSKLPFPPPETVALVVTLEASSKSNRPGATPILKGELRKGETHKEESRKNAPRRTVPR
jgi:hypothetical protein